MSDPRFRRFVIAGALLGLGLTMSACGSGSDATSSAARATPGLSSNGAAASVSAGRATEAPGPAGTSSAVRPAGVTASPAAAQTGGRATEIDPCRLVTAEEATAALGGRQPKPPTRRVELGDHRCFYEAMSGGDLLVVSIDEESGSGKVREAQETVRRALGFERVSGVGDAAFINPGLNLIDVVSGNVRFFIQIAATRGLPQPEIRPKLIELGRVAVTRMR